VGCFAPRNTSILVLEIFCKNRRLNIGSDPAYFGAMQDIKIMVWRSKNRRSEFGCIRAICAAKEPAFFFCGVLRVALRGDQPRTIQPRKKPRERNRSEMFFQM